MKNTPFHLLQWQYDLLGGQEIETIRRGNLDGAVLTAQGGQLIIPEADGGGRVHHFRGAWLTAVEFTWEGYWAAPRGTPTNYFTGGSAVNSGNQTIITLGTDPGDGTELQFYYYYGSGQTFAPKTPIEAYPAFIPCRQGTKQKFSSAPDADQWIALAMLEARARWDDFKRCYGWSIIESLKKFAESGDQAIIDDFNRDPSRVRDEGHWTYSGSDPASTITPSITEEGTLRIDSNIAEGGFGYFGWGRPIYVPPAAEKILMLYKGQGSGKAWQLAVNTDPGGSYDLDKIFYFGVVDFSIDWRAIEAGFAQFTKIKNLIWDGDRIDWNIWGVTPEERYYMGELVGATAGEFGRHQAEWIEGGFNHGQCLRVDMRHVNSRFANTTILRVSTTPSIDTRTVEGISFGVRWIFDAFAVHQLWVEIVDGQFSPEELGGASAWWYIDGAELAYWKRINLKWTDLTWGWENVPNLNPITQIRFNFVLKTNFGGMSSIRDESSTAFMDDFNWIPAGQSVMARETYAGFLAGGGSRYLSNAQINVAPGQSSMEWDEIKLDVPIIDTWEGCVRFTYQWSEQGRVEWRGPMYSGYQCPAVWELAGETAIAAKLMDFLKAAQDEYASRYSAQAGPFMPVWVPISNENPAEYGGTAETWGWNGPDTNTNWAGFQYRALAAAGHYYYLTGGAEARAVLDNWMSWIDTRILAGGVGWKVPSDFVKESAGYEYNYFSPDLHALIAQSMIFKYWRDGDTIAKIWFRRLLNDLAGRQLSNGLFTQSSGDIFGFHQGEVGKALGMLLNGRTSGQVNYPITAEPTDRTAFERLINGLINARGRTKPCALDFDDWLPLHHFYDQAQQLSEKIWVGNSCGTSEGIGLCLMVALDWALYSGDKTWFKKLAIWLNAELGLFVVDY